MSRECPCHRDCPDRNATCHTTKGNCPHDFEGWAKEQQEERERIRKAKQTDIPYRTKAGDTRHFNYIKRGKANTKGLWKKR